MLEIHSAQPCSYDSTMPRGYEVWTHERNGRGPDDPVQFRRNRLHGNQMAIAKKLKLTYGTVIPSMNNVLGALWDFPDGRNHIPLGSLVTVTLVQLCEGPHNDGTETALRYEGYGRDVWVNPRCRRALFELAAKPELNDEGLGIATDVYGLEHSVVAAPMATDEEGIYTQMVGVPVLTSEDAPPYVLLHQKPRQPQAQLERLHEFPEPFCGF